VDNRFALTVTDSPLSTVVMDTGTRNRANNHHTPPEYSREIILYDGTRTTIRPITCEDKDALLAFHSRLSDFTLYLRYHYSKGPLTEKDLKDLCELDYQNALALVAEVERNGVKEIIGVGRFIRLPIKHTAEVAIVIQDSEQNKGLGTQLLRHLSILAWQREIYYFFGEVLRRNGKMLSIFRRGDPHMKQEVDSATTCTVTVSVLQTMH
jgi:hypothetical protein